MMEKPPGRAFAMLRDAARDNDAAGVASALANGAYPDEGPESLLVEAARRDSEEITRLLLAAGADANRKGLFEIDDPVTPLMIALMRKNPVLIQLLLPGSNVNEKSERLGRAALHFAATGSGEKSDTCWRLIADACDWSILDNNGRSALHVAAEWGAVERVRELMPRLDPRQRDGKGLDALMSAAGGDLSNDLPMILLLAPHCDLRAVDNQGRTAMMIAAEKGRHNWLRAFLEHNFSAAEECGAKSFDSALLGYEKTLKIIPSNFVNETHRQALAGGLDQSMKSLCLLKGFASGEQKQRARCTLSERWHGAQRAEWEAEEIAEALRAASTSGSEKGDQAPSASEWASRGTPKRL